MVLAAVLAAVAVIARDSSGNFSRLSSVRLSFGGVISGAGPFDAKSEVGGVPGISGLANGTIASVAAIVAGIEASRGCSCVGAALETVGGGAGFFANMLAQDL